MGRRFIDVIESIFERLKSHIDNDDVNRISNAKLQIREDEDKQVKNTVIEILKHAKLFKPLHKDMLLCELNSAIYLITKFDVDCNSLDFLMECDNGYYTGFGILGMGNEFIQVSDRINSLQLIEFIFGLEPEDNGIAEIDFDTLTNFFEQYHVYKLNKLEFITEYEEDLARLSAILLNQRYYNNYISEILNQILLLESSRSIAHTVQRCVESSLVEHKFLELYRCIEFMFIIGNAKQLIDKYLINFSTTKEIFIELLIMREIKKSEISSFQNLLFANCKNTDLVKKIRDFQKNEIDYTVSEINCEEEKDDNHEKSLVATFIYDLRCRIAHLQYKHNSVYMDEEKWHQLLGYMSEMTLEIFEELDEFVTEVSLSNNVWVKASAYL